MQRFQFTLEKVLRVRQHETDLVKQAVAAALHEVARAEAAVRAAEADLTAAQSEWSQKSSGRLTVQQWQAFSERHQGLIEIRTLRLDELAATEAALAERRAELAEARRKEQILEKLKERQWEAYQQEALRAEQAVLDEMAAHTKLVWKEADLR